MGKSSKKLRKVQQRDASSQDDSEAEDMLNEEMEYDRSNDEFSDDYEDEQEDSDGEEEDEGNNQNSNQKDAEMEELEKELSEIRHQEQDLLKNLRRNKDEDLLKGQAVKNQKALWDKTLELRFLLQKAFVSSNRLPKEPFKSSFCDSESKVHEAYSNLISSSRKTLESLLELQEALLEKNPTIVQASDGNSGQTRKQTEASGSSNGDDEEWSRISEMQSRIASFRNKSVDKWQRKTQVTTGAAAFKGKLQAFNQNISEQVASYMRDPTRMIKGMQQNRSTIAIFGTVSPNAEDNDKEQELKVDGDPDLLDDSEFYQQLLKEFFETVDPTSSETALYALKRMQPKKRKIVDRRASKSRKIRYNVHEKIVNFMAPQPMNVPPMATKLFENLFSLKTQKPLPV